MKPAERTINWVCYPPDYRPEEGHYRIARSLKEATKFCRQWGSGSSVSRNLVIKNKRHQSCTSGFLVYYTEKKR